MKQIHEFVSCLVLGKDIFYVGYLKKPYTFGETLLNAYKITGWFKLTN